MHYSLLKIYFAISTIKSFISYNLLRFKTLPSDEIRVLTPSFIFMVNDYLLVDKIRGDLLWNVVQLSGSNNWKMIIDQGWYWIGNTIKTPHTLKLSLITFICIYF